MTLDEAVVARIQELPGPLAEEVGDFVEFLRVKHDRDLWQSWLLFAQGLSFAEAGMVDYLANLEDYEERLARGESRWS